MLPKFLTIEMLYLWLQFLVGLMCFHPIIRGCEDDFQDFLELMFPSLKSFRGNRNEKWISVQLEQGKIMSKLKLVHKIAKYNQIYMINSYKH
jgi:hypothetical protein